LPMTPQPVIRALGASAHAMVEEQGQYMLYLVEQNGEKNELLQRHWKCEGKLSDPRTVARNAMEKTPVAYIVHGAEGQGSHVSA
jgi:hypothetical protein